MDKMKKITDTQIAKESERSPQVIFAMKKAYPKQYRMLKIATDCIQNGVVDSKEYSEMNREELTTTQEKLIKQMGSILGDFEIVSDFIAEAKE